MAVLLPMVDQAELPPTEVVVPVEMPQGALAGRVACMPLGSLPPPVEEVIGVDVAKLLVLFPRNCRPFQSPDWAGVEIRLRCLT